MISPCDVVEDSGSGFRVTFSRGENGLIDKREDNASKNIRILKAK